MAKAKTDIKGLDEITAGGLPVGGATLVCSGPGCGKTVLAMEFLVLGAAEEEEPGLFVSFEESIDQLAKNFRSLGFGLLDSLKNRRITLLMPNLTQVSFRVEETAVSISSTLKDTWITLNQRLIANVRHRELPSSNRGGWTIHTNPGDCLCLPATSRCGNSLPRGIP